MTGRPLRRHREDVVVHLTDDQASTAAAEVLAGLNDSQVLMDLLVIGGRLSRDSRPTLAEARTAVRDLISGDPDAARDVLRSHPHQTERALGIERTPGQRLGHH